MVIHWFRRDLRLEDNAALYVALKDNEEVQSIFIFDKNILDKLGNKKDARVQFIHQEIKRLNQELSELGSSIWVFYGNPIEIYAQLIEKHNITKVYANRDYEPYALQRDKTIFELL